MSATSTEGETSRGIGRPRDLERLGAAHRRTLVTVAKAFHIDGRSRVEIADELGISRFKVARCLEEARQVGIVSITVMSSSPLPALSQELAHHLGLRRARVVEVFGDTGNVRAAVGREAGTLLNEGLAEGEVLGIGWGRTLDTMFDDIDHLPAVEIVQLSGRFPGDVSNSAAQLTRRSVALTGGTSARVIRAPFFISDARQAHAARRHPNIASVVADFDRITTAVVGIGAVGTDALSMAYSAIPERFLQSVRASGSVGEVQGALFAADGHTVSSNSRHTLNITPRQLAKVPRVIAAAADPRKAAAVHAVCRSGILTDLVVDVELATALLGRSPVTETFHAARPATDD